jgi:hypothetical protein
MAWHKRLLSADPDAGYREWYWSDPDDGKIALETEWLVEPIHESAKRAYAATDQRARWIGDGFHHVAYLPRYVIEYFRHKGVNLLTDRDALRWWLNNRDYSAGFRTRPGRV